MKLNSKFRPFCLQLSFNWSKNLAAENGLRSVWQVIFIKMKDSIQLKYSGKYIVDAATNFDTLRYTMRKDKSLIDWVPFLFGSDVIWLIIIN